MGTRHSKKVMPARPEQPNHLVGAGWTMMEDGQGNTIFWHPGKQMHGSLEYGNFFTTSRRNVLMRHSIPGFEDPELMEDTYYRRASASSSEY